MGISEIDSPEKLRKWLEEKPVEWSLIIGIRMILRSAPLAFAGAALSEKDFERQRRENLVLTPFRIMFLAKVFCDYSDIATKNNIKNKVSKAIKDAYVDLGLDLEYKIYTSQAEFTLKAAIDLMSFLVNLSDRLAALAKAVENASQAMRLGDVKHNNSPMYAASSLVEIRLNDNFWNRIRADINFLNQSEPASSKYNQRHSQLMSQPLWLEFEQHSNIQNVMIPDFIIKAFDSFKASDLAQTTSFGLITDWYKAAIEGKSAFGKKAELAIAKMSQDDWGDKDEERDCIAVMDRVKEIAGWSRDMTRGGDFYLDNEEQEELYDASRGAEKSYFNSEKIKYTLKENKNVVLSMCQSLLLQIAEYKEKIRGKNQIDEQTRNDLIAFLGNLEADLKDIVEAVETDGMRINDDTVKRVKSRLNRFNYRFKENLPKYFEPEHLADITPPVSIILGCGSIGALFGGPVGFGIGAFVGKLVTQEAKPGQSSDKVREMFEQEDTNINS